LLKAREGPPPAGKLRASRRRLPCRLPEGYRGALGCIRGRLLLYIIEPRQGGSLYIKLVERPGLFWASRPRGAGKPSQGGPAFQEPLLEPSPGSPPSLLSPGQPLHCPAPPAPGVLPGCGSAPERASECPVRKSLRDILCGTPLCVPWPGSRFRPWVFRSETAGMPCDASSAREPLTGRLSGMASGRKWRWSRPFAPLSRKFVPVSRRPRP
jgi:hypothetical protein